VAIGALFRLRAREPDVARPVKAWGYPVVPALFLAVAVVLTASQIAANPLRSLVGLGVIVAGIPLFLVSRHGPATEC